MNFDGVTAITIPEGNVKKIMRGDKVLWQKTTELVCEPTVNVGFARGYDYIIGASIYMVNATITGIDDSLIQSVEIGANIMEPTQRPDGSMVSTLVTKYQKVSYSSNGTTHTTHLNFPDYTGTTYQNGFAARLTYTDLTGATKTLVATTP